MVNAQVEAAKSETKKEAIIKMLGRGKLRVMITAEYNDVSASEIECLQRELRLPTEVGQKEWTIRAVQCAAEITTISRLYRVIQHELIPIDKLDSKEHNENLVDR